MDRTDVGLIGTPAYWVRCADLAGARGLDALSSICIVAALRAMLYWIHR